MDKPLNNILSWCFSVVNLFNSTQDQMPVVLQINLSHFYQYIELDLEHKAYKLQFWLSGMITKQMIDIRADTPR